MYANTNDESVVRIVRAAFPEYKGKRPVHIEPWTHPINVNSFWDSGSRDLFTLINIGTLQRSLATRQSHPMFNRGADGQSIGELDLPPVPDPNVALVQWKQGRCEYITIHIHPDALAPLLPPPSDMTDDERIVLKYTRQLKSSYAGISNYRFHEANSNTGITLARWDTARVSLIGKKLLNKAGAITADGRNAMERR